MIDQGINPALVTGAVSVGPAGTPLPSNVDAPLNQGLRDLGYIGEDGMGIRDVTKGRKLRHHEIGFTVLDEVDIAPLTPRRGLLTRTLVALKLKKPPTISWVFRTLKEGRRTTLTVPHGELIEVGDVMYSRGKIVATTLVIKSWPDRQGNYVYVFTGDRPIESDPSTGR